MIRISVIMPVYNVEEYIDETLNSILNQSMIDEIEVIMVDDGSTDNSRYVIEEYAKNYENFHAYHKNHEGQGIARNYGLEFAQGEYVHFMDADDYLPPKAYENLYYFNPLNDFIVGNVLKFGEYNIWENFLFKEAFKNFEGDVKSFKLQDAPQILWDTITCNKLFKKEFLDIHNIRFINKDTYYEDLLFSLEAYIHANSIGFSQSIFYYWRLRSDKSSITQQMNDVRNFEHRLEILNMYNNIMFEYSLGDEFKNVVYVKWLKHDLKTSLKKISNYPGKHYIKLIEETNKIVKLIPNHLKDDLNVYLKILYNIVENNDINAILAFAHLEDNIKLDPQVIPNIDSKYYENIKLTCDGRAEEFEAHVSDVYNDDDNLYLEISENLSYVPNKCPHKILVFMLYKNYEIPLNLRKNQVIIPLDLIKDLNHIKLKVIYSSKKFEKEVLLRNYNRKSISYAHHDIDLGIGINNILYLDVRKKTENHVVIDDVTLRNGELIFSGESKSKIVNLILTNFVTYNQISYPAIYDISSNRFNFAIPFEDLNVGVIKKWELNCLESFNSINFAHEFKIPYRNLEIIFKNKRNKLYIEYNVINTKNQRIEELLSKNDELIKENNKLNKENINLNKSIVDFKSRKAVKIVDGIKNLFNRKG